MTDSILAALETLHKMNFFPEIFLLSIGLYYIVRWHLDWGPKRSQYVPIVAALVGIFGYMWPKTAQDIIKILVTGGVHAFVSMGAYSYAEKRGWVDQIGEWIEDKLGFKHPTPKGPGAGGQGPGSGEAQPPSTGAPGFSRIGALLILAIVMLAALVMFSGCSPASVIKALPHDVQTETVAQEPIVQSEPVADAKKDDVPVGVKPADVVAIVEQPQPNGTTEKTWIVQEKSGLFGKKKLKVYQNKAASSPAPGPGTPAPAPVAVHTMEPSHFWRWTLLIIATIILLWAARRYIPFFGVLTDSAEAAAKPLLAEVAAEAGEASAHALKNVKSLRQRICEKVKAFIGGNA